MGALHETLRNSLAMEEPVESPRNFMEMSASLSRLSAVTEAAQLVAAKQRDGAGANC